MSAGPGTASGRKWLRQLLAPHKRTLNVTGIPFAKNAFDSALFKLTVLPTFFTPPEPSLAAWPPSSTSIAPAETTKGESCGSPN